MEKEKKEFKKRLWIVADKNDGEILQVAIDKDYLNEWDDGKKVYATVTFKI